MHPKIYFGHPINVYDTPFERMLLQKIQEAFPDWVIENPNKKRHADGYKRLKSATGNGMTYFFTEVLPHCDAGIFLPFRDGKWGAGVSDEARFLCKQDRPIWQMGIDGRISKTRLDTVATLSITETRMRIRDLAGKIIPY